MVGDLRQATRTPKGTSRPGDKGLLYWPQAAVVLAATLEKLALVGLCALGRIRTCNLLIRSQVLYPLSYERLPPEGDED